MVIGVLGDPGNHVAKLVMVEFKFAPEPVQIHRLHMEDNFVQEQMKLLNLATLKIAVSTISFIEFI